MVDDGQRTTDIGRSQKLTMSTSCSGELKRVITEEIRVAELGFLRTALLYNELYRYLKYQVVSSYSLEVMARTKIQS